MTTVTPGQSYQGLLTNCKGQEEIFRTTEVAFSADTRIYWSVELGCGYTVFQQKDSNRIEYL